MPSLKALTSAWRLRLSVRPRLAGQTLTEQRRELELVAGHSAPPSGTVLEAVRIGELEAEQLSPPGSNPGRFLLWFFGGGYQAGSPATTRALAARIGLACRATVLVPRYRLCPESPLSAGLEDGLAAYRFLAAKLGSGSRLAVGGESAGGGLALRLLVALRDAGDQLPAAGALISPWTDLAMTGSSLHRNSRSDVLFSPAFLAQMTTKLVVATEFRDPSISPVYADLSGLPPLLVHVSGGEALLDDSLRLLNRHDKRAHDITVKIFPGLWHAFHQQADLPEAGRAVKEIGVFLSARFELASEAAAGQLRPIPR